jgi:hypothetical protein
MQHPPDRPQGVPIWAVLALVAALAAGGVWWILRSSPKPEAEPKATPMPCQPVSPAPSPSTLATGTRVKDWEITVTSAMAAPSVPARGGGSYRAAPGEQFVVVAVTFRNLHPGTESAVSTSLVRLVCSDGTERPIAGFDDGRGFCRVCGLDLGTDQRRVRWTFIFRMERKFLSQSFRFRYGEAPPIDLSLTG